jgi:hypothetical protein
MKQLYEAGPYGWSGIVVADIDDTIVRADPSEIGIWRITDNADPVRLTTEEFSKRNKSEVGVKYDYHEFRDPVKVRDSILRGTPLLGNLKIIDEYLNDGYDFALLTARGAEDMVIDVMEDYLKTRNRNGELEKLTYQFKKGLSHACSDEKYMEILSEYTDPDKKAYFIEKIAKDYDHVLFLDDDDKNLEAVSSLGLENVEVVKAHNN